ncbi:MAG: hypothetical protein ACP5XB_28925 [Isosphaeraceae bacterium]
MVLLDGGQEIDDPRQLLVLASKLGCGLLAEKKALLSFLRD